MLVLKAFLGDFDLITDTECRCEVMCDSVVNCKAGERDDLSVRSLITRGSPQLADFLSRALSEQRRTDMSQLLTHPWL